MSTGLLVLHDLGDAGGGGPWRRALEEAGWPGTVEAPDLPGHARAPAPPGGAYEVVDPVLDVVRRAGPGGPTVDGRRPVVLGVGASGWAATLLALGGRASGLVLVDGLGAPWRDPVEDIAAGAARLRALAADPAAVGPPPAPGPGVLDPVLAHRLLPHGSRAYARRATAQLEVPALFVESSRSPLPAEEAEALAARVPAGAAVARVADASPEGAADAVARWGRASAGRAGVIGSAPGQA